MQRFSGASVLVQVWAKSHGHVEAAYITAGGCLFPLCCSSLDLSSYFSLYTDLFSVSYGDTRPS
jgi:hypothetical protein